MQIFTLMYDTVLFTKREFDFDWGDLNIFPSKPGF